MANKILDSALIPYESLSKFSSATKEDKSSRIPDDLLFQVFTYLSYAQLGKAFQVCKRWSHLINQKITDLTFQAVRQTIFSKPTVIPLQQTFHDTFETILEQNLDEEDLDFVWEQGFVKLEFPNLCQLKFEQYGFSSVLDLNSFKIRNTANRIWHVASYQILQIDPGVYTITDVKSKKLICTINASFEKPHHTIHEEKKWITMVESNSPDKISFYDFEGKEIYVLSLEKQEYAKSRVKSLTLTGDTITILTNRSTFIRIESFQLEKTESSGSFTHQVIKCISIPDFDTWVHVGNVTTFIDLDKYPIILNEDGTVDKIPYKRNSELVFVNSLPEGCLFGYLDGKVGLYTKEKEVKEILPQFKGERGEQVRETLNDFNCVYRLIENEKGITKLEVYRYDQNIFLMHQLIFNPPLYDFDFHQDAMVGLNENGLIVFRNPAHEKIEQKVEL